MITREVVWRCDSLSAFSTTRCSLRLNVCVRDLTHQKLTQRTQRRKAAQPQPNISRKGAKEPRLRRGYSLSLFAPLRLCGKHSYKNKNLRTCYAEGAES